MPHITLQYSDNIAGRMDFDTMFSKIHDALGEMAGIDIKNCKSRAIKLADYRVAGGGAELAFAHLEVRILAGRSDELKGAIGGRLLGILKDHIQDADPERNPGITVEICDIQRQAYFKA